MQAVSDTYTHFQFLCPFHNNSDITSPALAVDKELGLWICFNPSCGETGDLPTLVRLVGRKTVYEAIRLIKKHKNSEGKTLSQRLSELYSEDHEFVEFPQESLDGLKETFWKSNVAIDYMLSRGFTKATLEFFGIGYSAKQRMVIVPMHDPNGMPIGLIGRTPSNDPAEKRFKNSKSLPKAQTLWNFHRAKRHGSTCIVVEASYDAMRVHQAGYPNVVATLGGSITEAHVRQLSRSFDRIIILTDFDKKQFRASCRKCRSLDFPPNAVRCVGHRPGRELGHSIVNAMKGARVLWGHYDDTCVYPHNAKDAGDMTDDEIRQCIENAVTNFEYTLLYTE